MTEFTRRSDRSQDGTTSARVIEAVAEARGVDPLDLPPLYDVIDPDALNRLFNSDSPGRPNGPGRVTFTLSGCEVVVESDGEVTATAPRNLASSATAGSFGMEQDEPEPAAE